MTRPDFTNPTGVEGDYTTPADGSHVKTTTQVKTLGDTSQYPNTEAGVKSVLRSEIDAEMSGAHNSLWSILGGLLNGVGEALAGITGPALKFLGDAAGTLISGVVGLVQGFATVIDSVLNRKSIPSDTPETFSAIAADLEGALEPFHEKVDEALNTAKENTGKAKDLNDLIERELDPKMVNSRLWHTQNAINAAHEEAELAMQEAIKANSSAISTMTEYVNRMHYIPAGVSQSNEHWQVTYSGTTATLKTKPGWAGTAIYFFNRKVRRNTSNEGLHVHDYDLILPYMTTTLMEPGRYYRISDVESPIVIHYNISSGTPKRTTVTGTSVTPDDEWVQAASWRLPADTKFSAYATYTFDAKTYLGSYGGRLRLDGKTISNSSTSGGAPIVGHGPRSGSVSAAPQSGKEGQLLTLEVYAKHGNSLNRRVSSPVMEISWIEPPAPGDDEIIEEV